MATNPMQRKARNSFLLGMLLMLVVLGAVIVFLFLQIKNYREKEAEAKANNTYVYVLSQDVTSGQVITTDMFKRQEVDRTIVPNNAIGDMSIISNYSLADKEGNEVITEYKNNVATLYLQRNGNNYELKEEDTGNYYIEVNGSKEYIELTEAPLIAKVDMNKNTIITVNMISKSDEKTTNDLRIQEYNMLELPIQLEAGEYIDVRLALASGQDYIVISKKLVEIPEINGVPSADTIILNLREDEIITMNSAIVEAYKMAGSRLYVNRYKEAGIQDAATPTYIPSGTISQLILDDPNVIQEARTGLYERYNSGISTTVRNAVEQSISNNPQGDDNLNSKIQESQSNTKQKRQEYLESIY